jgi:hypothetical protein
MPYYQSAQVKMSSGEAGTTFQTIERVQSATVGYQIPRVDVSQLGRFAQLKERPVVNYTPVSFSIEAIKSSKEIELNFGLINSTGVGILVGNGNGNTISGYSARNLEFINSQSNSANYDNKFTVLSGCINSYSVSANVGDFAKVSINGEGLDLKVESFSNAKENTLVSSSLVRSQDISISGIQFSGAGLTGFTPQSFNLGINFSRQAINQFGQKFPSRQVNGVSASLSMNGFLEGVNPVGGLSGFDCGTSLTGSIFLTLVPSCSGAGPATTYKITNPYIDSFNLGASVGSYTSVEIGMSLPISVLASEAADGSNIIIS